jgi:dihydroflavonol-4-reductase
VLGGTDMTLRDILQSVAAITGRRPPRLSLPHAAVLPFAYAGEAWARLSGREPFATVDGVRMARKRMFFSSAKAARELGYRTRPVGEAERDAVDWFRAHGYLT